MPTISRFYGIAIRMHFNEHGVPHFHAHYGGASASFGIRELAVLEGHLPPRATRLVKSWARKHRTELLSNWRLARQATKGDSALEMKRMIHEIVEVEVTGPAKVVATFEDGERREVDLSEDLYGEVFEPLKDPRKFAQVKIEYGTLEWPTGLGLDPVVIYECMPQLKVRRLEPDPSLSQAKPRSPR